MRVEMQDAAALSSDHKVTEVGMESARGHVISLEIYIPVQYMWYSYSTFNTYLCCTSYEVQYVFITRESHVLFLWRAGRGLG